jgi:hypothetical protein
MKKTVKSGNNYQENVGISRDRSNLCVSHLKSNGSKAFTALAFKRKTIMVLHVFTAKANMEDAVILQEV